MKSFCPKVTIFTLFPELFPGTLGVSILARAMKDGLWSLSVVDIRDFAKDGRVDDYCFGGGPGMLMRPDVIGDAVDKSLAESKKDTTIIALSPRGKRLNQKMLEDWEANSRNIAIISGRYEGIDARILESEDILELSVGDFVANDGDGIAMVIASSYIRLFPGVLGSEESLQSESFSDSLLEYPQYTKPRVWNGITVPPILLSGNHGLISEWRSRRAKEITMDRSSDAAAEVFKDITEEE